MSIDIDMYWCIDKPGVELGLIQPVHLRKRLKKNVADV